MEKTGRVGRILQWSRRIRWVLSFVLLSYALAALYLWALQKPLIFMPRAQMQTSPERYGLTFDEVHISSGSAQDQGMLYGWWLPASFVDAPTMLFLHGNDSNISSAFVSDKLQRLHDMGYHVLVVDYRGYGKSTGGNPSEAKVYEDADAAWKYLIQQRGCNPKRTFIYGHSLGGAIAIDLAAHHPEAAGLITESTFTSMSDMGRREYPYMPIDLLLDQRFDSLDKIASLKIPVLFIHGTWDSLIPYQMSERLYARAPQPKTLRLIEGGEHNGIAMIAPLEFRAAVNNFVQRNLVH